MFAKVNALALLCVRLLSSGTHVEAATAATLPLMTASLAAPRLSVTDSSLGAWVANPNWPG